MIPRDRPLRALLRIAVPLGPWGVPILAAGLVGNLAEARARGRFSDLPRAYFDRIQQVPGVRVVNLANYIGATYQNPKQHFLIISTLPRNWAQITTDVIVPPAAVAALERTRTGAVLGAIVAWALFNGHHISPLGINFDPAVTPGLAVTGIVWALLMGLVGGLMPAFRSARVPVTEALRAI